jgi:tetratricopeptide (TPR) repeat protein
MSRKLGRTRRTTILFSCLSALVFVQCAVAEDPIAKGNRSLNAGHYDEALEAYSKALSRAKDDRFAQERAIAMYGLARTNARLCRVDTAEKWFRDSIALRETLPDVLGLAWLTQNYLEFARFLLSRGRTEEAAEYMGRAIPMLDDLGLEYSDPIAYAELLDDYAAALKAVGKDPESQVQADRAANLRRENPGVQADFKPMSYPADCDVVTGTPPP